MQFADRLLLVAGPSCSGKSTLIQRLFAGELQQVAASLRLGDPAAWSCVLPQDLGDEGPKLERVILHYDFLRPWTGGRTPDYGAEGPLRLAETAGEVTLVTLWVPPGVLHRRMVERRSSFVASLLRGRPWNAETLRATGRTGGPPPDGRRSLRKAFAIVRELRRLNEKVRSYRRPGELAALYKEWVTFWEPRRVEHWILDSTADPPTLVPLAQWLSRS